MSVTNVLGIVILFYSMNWIGKPGRNDFFARLHRCNGSALRRFGVPAVESGTETENSALLQGYD
jgi:hypothetical protein